MNKEMKQYLYVGIIALLLIFIGIYLVTCNPYSYQQTTLLNNTGIIPSTNINEIIPAQNISIPIQSSMDLFSIDAQIPETPRYIPLYKGTLSDDDRNKYFKYESPNWLNRKNHTPSQSEAPAIAEKALAAYGGLPKDAVLSGVFISESVTEKTSGVITERYPIRTQVFYQRQINGIPVVGERDIISVDLGENGELLAVMKRWRTLEKTGDVVQVTTPDKAVEKLKHGETYSKLQSSKAVHIDDVRLGYYEKPGKIREIILEPVWIFKSMSEPGVEFPVYARQFAGFTQGPTATTKSVAGKTASQADSLTVTFTDTSDAGPTKWHWDFGDGTTSSDKNPVHTYKSAGTYNVSLTVWNDMGSDTLVQQCVVEGEAVKTTVTTISTITGTIPTTIPATTIVTNTRTVSTTATIAVNQTQTLSTTISPVPTTSVLSITVNETATASPVPTTAVTISPTSSPGITGNTTSGNTTAG